MKVTVKKVDDINFIMSGTVDNKIIQERVALLKSQAKADATENEDFQEVATGQVFKDFVAEGIKEANIDIENILGQPGVQKYEQLENGIYFEVSLATSPTINLDVNYMDAAPKFTKPVASPQAVEDKLKEFTLKQAPFSKIKNPRLAQNGDVTVIDFAGYIDGKLFEGGSAEKFNLKIGSESFIPGFEEQLIGMDYGEEKTIVVTFPKDYQAEDLAGKETTFIVKLHEIQEQKPETPDDAFAKKILADPKATLDTLKGKFADQVISEELSQLYMSELKPKLVKKLLEKFEFTLPNNIVEHEIDAKVREKTRSFSEAEHKVYADNKDKFAELRESLREEAGESIKKALIVEAIAEKEGVVVPDQEVHAALGYQAMMTGQDGDELLKYYEENNLMTSAKMGLTEDKLFGIMLGFDK